MLFLSRSRNQNQNQNQPAAMSTHSAIATTSKGVLESIQIKTEKPGPGEILLKTSYSSMIAFDTYVTDLGYHVQEYPQVLGFNASGVAAAIGEGVDGIAVGDKVNDAAHRNGKILTLWI